MLDFSQKIVKWYLNNKRDLPWRNTNNPYLIWLSEIILQQTRVNQGMDYYHKFTEEFPTVKDLAEAQNEKVMKLWQGLGYYSRARNLHETAKIINTKHFGTFPNEHSDILSLKGIGDYTAAAISSFAFNQPYAVVDGNVYRVLSRVFGKKTPIDSTKGKKEFLELANQLIDKRNPGTHNQAIMEFGAIQCKPSNPNCTNCPLNTMCYAFENNKVDFLPVKEKKTKVRNRYFNYLVLENNGITAIKKRTHKDIWENLYDFPLIETSQNLSPQKFIESEDWKNFIKNTKYTLLDNPMEFTHILSHQKIHARFWEIKCDTSIKELQLKKFDIIEKNDLNNYAIPRLIEKYLHSSKLLH